MSLIVNNNVSALKAHNSLTKSNRGLSSAIEKLSSGLRINTGKDDPSGLVISEQLRSQISGLERAVRNSNEASNLIGIAEGALNEMNEILKKLRALAIHSANEVTSPEQVEADQAEMDSGIQTLNRIANTTKYSDQNLLNGSKQLVYDIDTVVNDTADHGLLDPATTRVDQIYKRTGVTMTVSYTGYKSDSQANSSTSAQRAYLEADSANAKCQVDGNAVTAAQKFILTGTTGSKQFNYTAGTSLGTIVADINNSTGSTGIGATLIFASNARIDKTAVGATAEPVYPATPATGLEGYDDGTYSYTAGDVQIYGADINDPANAKVSTVTITEAAANSLIVGYNCDGDGKVYAKVVDAATNAIEWYKDKDCTMLIGMGDDTFFSATNNAGIPGSPTDSLDGLFLTLTDQAQNLDVYEIAVVGQRLDNQKDMTTSLSGWVDVDNSVISGVNLGVNTSQDGDIYFKYSPVSLSADGTTVLTFKVEAFSDESFDPKYLVASSGVTTASAAVPQSITVESVTMANGKESGLNLTLTVPSDALPALPKVEMTGNVSFTNLGLRLYSVDYGSDEYIRIQNQEGQLFYYYRESDTLDKVMIEGEKTVMVYGQDALISMNGASIITNGLVADTTTADFSGVLSFNAGSLGLTTLAVAGYDAGSLYARAESLQAVEENETQIAKEERYFEPQSFVVTLAGMVDSNGKDIDLYLDFSDLDPSVRARIDNLGAASTIVASYVASTPPTITIDASDLSTGGAINVATLNVDVDKLYHGMQSTEAEMKGLFLKTSAKIDTDQSAAATASEDIIAYQGDRLTEVNTYATNPRTNTSENLSDFLGGMQFQLGNTSGDQDRTVYSIQSMDMSNLGRVVVDGVAYTLQDVLGGGVASLGRDPILAMSILEKAVDDVTNLRARLGAFQANMLQTNINSLEVAIENITLTESAIRDTDMASESTNYTKNQIMVQAGTSMLAQANQINQNVLTLLQ